MRINGICNWFILTVIIAGLYALCKAGCQHLLFVPNTQAEISLFGILKTSRTLMYNLIRTFLQMAEYLLK
jgi:hypothetical protein